MKLYNYCPCLLSLLCFIQKKLDSFPDSKKTRFTMTIMQFNVVMSHEVWGKICSLLYSLYSARVKTCEKCDALNFTLRRAESIWRPANGRRGCPVSWLTEQTHSLNVGESVAFWEVVRVPLPEHVTHAAAGKNLQASSAHPHPERKLCRRTDAEHEVKYVGR